MNSVFETLSPEEQEAVRAWSAADAANEELWRQTTDSAFLETEWRRHRQVDTARPLAAMQARIAQQRQHRQLRWWRAAAIFAAAVALGSLAYIYIQGLHAHDAGSGISAGTVHAMLQVVDEHGSATGEVVEFRDLRAGDQPLTTEQLLADYRSQQSALPRPRQEHSPTPASLSLITPRGGEFRIALEDGTEVWLNAQSQLIYPEHFALSERRVKVSGEAYFKVARDEQKPFIVEADGQAVSVLGTEFNVHSYAEDSHVETTLVSGSIALQPIGAGAAQLLLTPGHQAVFSKAEHDIQVRSIDTEVATSWKDGKFVFENQTLEQIMLTLSRWYDFTYSFADRRAAQKVFMGRIPRYADFADVVEILESSGGLRMTVEGKEVSIGLQSVNP